MSKHLPIRAMRPCYRTSLLDRHTVRAFSSTPSRSKRQGLALTDPSLIRTMVKNQQEQKSRGTLQQEAIESGEAVADDLGLLPGTFIRLPWRQCPSLFSSPKDRFQYERKWLWTRLQDRFQRFLYKWWSGIKPRPNISRAGLVDTAKQMHLDIYEAFAERNKTALSDICLTSMSSYVATRTANIPKDTRLEWTRDRIYGESNPLHWIGLAGPRIVSNRAVMLSIPGSEHTGVRQVVVRLSTSQTLTTTRKSSSPSKREPRRELAWTPDGSQPEPLDFVHSPASVSTIQDDVVEYLVLQKRILRNVAEEWKVWGFAEPTTLMKIESDRQQLQRIQNFQSPQTV